MKLITSCGAIAGAFMLLLAPIQLSAQDTKSPELGVNLLPFVGNTLAVDFNKPVHHLFSYSFGVSGMLHNKLPGGYTKEGRATYEHDNSGVAGSVGFRFTPRKESHKSYVFVGAKLIGGWFKQSAEYAEPFNVWFLE